MFHPEMNPDQVLTRLMQDSIETIEKLEDAGYPVNSIPPHSSSVYLISKGDDKSFVGLGKSEIEVLSSVDPDLWAPRSLYKLDCDSDNHHYPIGSFIGFVGSSEGSPDTPLFFGILISPSGAEAKGMYIHLNTRSEIHDLWKHPFTLAPHLQANYIASDSKIVH